MRILVLYDNVARPPLREGWGFSALIESGSRRVMFDTGADRLVLAHNARALGLDFSYLTDVFLSHPHCDHVGGLSLVLGEAKGVRLWAPAGMAGYLRPWAARAELVLVRGPRDLGEGQWSTGTMGRTVREHSLIVAGPEGAVLVTGCAHPGIDRVAARASRLVGGKLRLVLGGFHLGGASPGRLSAVAKRLAEASQSVAPGHCTGEKAIPLLLAQFPASFALEVGKEYQTPDPDVEGER